MRWTDLLSASIASLVQRPFRTFMTLLGVMIGSMSVISMVSLGLGMSESLTQQLGSNDSLTQITVMGSKATNPVDPNYKPMNATSVRELEAMDGVVDVIPTYTATVTMEVPPYSKGQIQVMGIPLEDMAAYGIEPARGQLPVSNTSLQLVVGDQFEYAFISVTDNAIPVIDAVDKPVFVTFDGLGTSDLPGQQETQPTDGTNANPNVQQPEANTGPKRVIAPVVAELASKGSFSMDDYQAFASLDALYHVMKQQAGSGKLPNQTTANADPKRGNFVYTGIVVKAESVEVAEQLNQTLRDNGWQTQANVELMKQVQQYGNITQAVFGGIGAVSLLVAAIGIANTMMMSVYERTKEIGIMKVLGASLSDIRKSFLVESAAIGFFGGLVGLILSLLVSVILNLTLGSLFGGTKASVIPPWLMIGAVAFSSLVGTLSGLAPAQRAMKLSPLAAIRAE